jgi:hypothetical protein
MEQHVDRLVSTVAVLLDREVEPASSGAPQPRTSRRRWVAAGLGGLAALVAVVVALVVTLGGGSDPGTDTDSGGPTASSTPSGQAAPFVDDFTAGVGAGWSWTNESVEARRTSPEGWLEIDSQESPPMHNVLLRDAPGTSYNVRLRLRFPATAAGFAGLVLMDDDPETRLEFGWTKEGLSTNEYKDGSLTAGAMMYTRDLNVSANRDIRLVLKVSDGGYRAQYYDREAAQYLGFGAGGDDLGSTFTHVGLMVYRNGAGGAGTAAFDSIEIY